MIIGCNTRWTEVCLSLKNIIQKSYQREVIAKPVEFLLVKYTGYNFDLKPLARISGYLIFMNQEFEKCVIKRHSFFSVVF